MIKQLLNKVRWKEANCRAWINLEAEEYEEGSFGTEMWV